MSEEECFKGVPFSEQGQAQKCHDDCKHQEFQGSDVEAQLKDDYDGDWDGGYGCHWLGWKSYHGSDGSPSSSRTQDQTSPTEETKDV